MSIDFELTKEEEELMEAIRMKRLDRVEECLKTGMGVNFPCGYFDEAPIHIAAQLNCPDIIERLVTAGARITRLDQQGQTALFHAAEKQADDAVAILLKLQCNPNHVAHTGRTAIFGAARFGYVSTIELLVRGGADPNFPADGSTPLFYAIGNSHFEAARTLVRKGARIDHKNSEGLTAEDVLRRRGSDFERDILSLRFLAAKQIENHARGGIPNDAKPLKRFRLREP